MAAPKLTGLSPRVGDTRRGPCSWCGREITHVWRKTIDVPAGFWDGGACSCGDLRAIGNPVLMLKLWGLGRHGNF